MTDINLLPWRELRREKDQKEFTILIGVALALALGIALAVNYYSVMLVDDQTRRNQRLKNEISTLDSQIASIQKLKLLRENLIARMKVAQSLQSKRALTVHLFDELIKILPDGVYLTDIKRAGNRVTVNGYSESNSNVAAMMRNIEDNPWIEAPKLTEIKKTDDANPGSAAATNDSKNPTFILSFVMKPTGSHGAKKAATAVTP